MISASRGPGGPAPSMEATAVSWGRLRNIEDIRKNTDVVGQYRQKSDNQYACPKETIESGLFRVLDSIRIQKVPDHFLIGGLVQVRLPLEEIKTGLAQ